MAVIPLTLAISFCLVFTFVVFFVREQSHHPFSSAGRESLLPLAEGRPGPGRRCPDVGRPTPVLPGSD